MQTLIAVFSIKISEKFRIEERIYIRSKVQYVEPVISKKYNSKTFVRSLKRKNHPYIRGTVEDFWNRHLFCKRLNTSFSDLWTTIFAPMILHFDVHLWRLHTFWTCTNACMNECCGVRTIIVRESNLTVDLVNYVVRKRTLFTIVVIYHLPSGMWKINFHGSSEGLYFHHRTTSRILQ